MSLLRNSLLVGAATTLVGIGLMELSSEAPKTSTKPSWYVKATLLTGLAGGLGYALVNNRYTPEVLELDAEGPTDDELEAWSERQDDGSMLVTIDEDGDSHTELTYDEEGDLTDLKRFMAEVFEATKKHRRRTTLSWTRGIEPAFLDSTTGIMRTPRPYDTYNYWNDHHYANHKGYHITGLPKGYHIHLWKPQGRRGNFWEVKMKSPHSNDWKTSQLYRKNAAMREVLQWYNDQIAIPAERKLTPMEQMLQQQGLISKEISIQRIEPTPEKTQWFYEGGPEGYSPTKFAERYGSQLDFFAPVPTELLNFCRGLSYVGWKKDGNLRSVNRYNKDRKQWVRSHPAWFQNMVREGIKELFIDEHSYKGIWRINGYDFLHFSDSGYFPVSNMKGKTVTLSNGVTKPIFAVRIESGSVKDADRLGVLSHEWVIPRPSTMRKMYENRDEAYWGQGKSFSKSDEIHILAECVAKYQPQRFESIAHSMTTGSVLDNTNGFGEYGHESDNAKGIAKAGHLMCRRFKKK